MNNWGDKYLYACFNIHLSGVCVFDHSHSNSFNTAHHFWSFADRAFQYIYLGI